MPESDTANLHRNSGLFSDYYLDATLPGRSDWASLTPEASPVLDEISRLLGSYVPGNEAQTEEALVRPILRALRHTRSR
ncbi:MAG: hypothetical protein ACR2KW_04085 [Rubrobacter sp.]